MGKRGFARKRDENEPGIIAALELAGCSVEPMDKPVDLLVGYRRGFEARNVLMEVKNGNQPPSWQRITPDQARFIESWQGEPVRVVSTIFEALIAARVGAHRHVEILEQLKDQYDEAGVPLGKNRAKK